MARTVRTKVYQFSELSEPAKEKARQWWREHGLDYEWHDMTIQNFKETAKEKGFKIDKIYFSGFSSQGDGAMFEGSVIDFSLFLNGTNPHFQKVIKNNGLDLSWSVNHSGHYYHSRCSQISFDAGNYPYTYSSKDGFSGNFQANIDILENNIEEAYHDYCHEIYRTLENEYDWLNSDEQVDESIEANEYEFTQDGRRF